MVSKYKYIDWACQQDSEKAQVQPVKFQDFF